MKIISYEKKANSKYKVKLDNDEEITLYDNVILNNNLLITKEILDKDLLLKENQFYEAYNKAIKYIGIKLRTKKEIINYLYKKYDKDIIDEVVNNITDQGYLNDELYVKSYINDQINLSNNGYYKILKDLLNKDIEESLIRKYLDQVDENIWKNKINKIVEKKIKNNSKYSSSYLKEKILYDLNNLGYDKNDILNIVNSFDIKEDDNIFEKDFNIILSKLSKKYRGNELKLHMINKLMAKGYMYEKIKNKLALTLDKC